MFVLGPEIATVLFAHGNTTHADALVISDILRVLAVALLPFSTYQLMLRVFYAFRDTRTPAFISLITGVDQHRGRRDHVPAAADPQDRRRHRRRLRHGERRRRRRLLVGAALAAGRHGRPADRRHAPQLLIAVWPLVGFAYAVHAITDAWIGTATTLPALAVLGIAAAGGMVLYLFVARLLKVAEVQTLLGTLAARLGRGRG